MNTIEQSILGLSVLVLIDEILIIEYAFKYSSHNMQTMAVIAFFLSIILLAVVHTKVRIYLYERGLLWDEEYHLKVDNEEEKNSENK